MTAETRLTPGCRVRVKDEPTDMALSGEVGTFVGYSAVGYAYVEIFWQPGSDPLTWIMHPDMLEVLP